MCNMADKMTVINQLEFFSGIGAMRLALKRAVAQNPNLKLGTVQAYDCNVSANQTYSHNFGSNPPVIVRNIEQIKCKEVDGKANIWTMSPPCQPFSTTANAKQRGLDDMRSKAFKHLTTLLSQMNEPPRWIVMENVKGLYEVEGALDNWWSVLSLRGYTWQQVLLSPLQFGIPNNRTRFFMVCTRREEGNRMSSDEYVNRDLSTLSDLRDMCGCGQGFSDEYQYVDLAKELPLHFKPPCKPVGSYMKSAEEIGESKHADLIVTDKVLKKPWARGLSVVGKQDERTFCFTSSYGTTYHKSAGSLYHMECELAENIYKPENGSETETMATHHSGKIRLFAPEEILALFDFPPEYSFPPEMLLRHQYKLAGQSVNVKVAEHLFHSIFCSNPQPVQGVQDQPEPKKAKVAVST